jgi:hypothetical protein
MDFDLDSEQKDLLDALGTLLDRHAGPERARAVGAADGIDLPLLERLIEGGFADFATEGAGPLEAALAVELVAARVGLAPYGSRAIVAPALLDQPLPEVLAVLDGAEPAPVRYAQFAQAFLMPRGTEAIRLERNEVEIEPIESPFAYPFATVTVPDGAGEALPLADGATTLRRWQRIAIAAEMVGCMQAALDLTVAYLSDRHQFGRPLGSFQALQHRLAELHIDIEGARWLTRQAAWRGADDELAAIACTAAAEAADKTVGETHQLSGAMGLTKEYDLHLWTMRLVALCQEGGGVSRHAADAAGRVSATVAGEDGR